MWLPRPHRRQRSSTPTSGLFLFSAFRIRRRLELSAGSLELFHCAGRFGFGGSRFFCGLAGGGGDFLAPGRRKLFRSGLSAFGLKLFQCHAGLMVPQDLAFLQDDKYYSTVAKARQGKAGWGKARRGWAWRG